jgi:ABC-2 type transport system ATP-binding protein
VSTHILEEVDAVCSRIIIIANGRILVDSTPDALKKEHNADLFDIFRNVTQGRKGVME